MRSAAWPQHRPQAWRVCPKVRPVPGPLSLAVPGGTRARDVPAEVGGGQVWTSPTWGRSGPRMSWGLFLSPQGPRRGSDEEAGSSRRWREAGLELGAMGVGEVKCEGCGHPRLRISSVRPRGLGWQKGQRVHWEPPLPAHHKRPGVRGAQSPQSVRSCCASLLTLCPLCWGLSGSCSPSPKQRPPLKPQERVGPGRGRANLDPASGPPRCPSLQTQAD